jgi:hypothetical protein
MHGFMRSVVLVALLLVAALGATPASAAQQPAPARLRGALAALTSPDESLARPGESLARLWTSVTYLLAGHRIDLAPVAARPAANSLILPRFS